MDNRIALRKNMRIVLSPFVFDEPEKKGKAPSKAETFYIEGELGRGSSAICYDAFYFDGNGQKITGSLKEFYPLDFASPAFDLERDESAVECHSKQLYSHKGTLENFLTFKKGYVKPYTELISVRGMKSQYHDAVLDLNNFFPDFELYQGTAPEGSDEKNCSVYVWVKNEPGFVTFGRVLFDVCERMFDGSFNRAMDLKLVLHSICALAKAVDTLHLFGLYHLDLKPENFGIKTFRGKVDKNGIGVSLYDINSLYSGRERDAVVMSAGTKYFRSPEVLAGSAERFGRSSDIYSLGAILYYALVIELGSDAKGKKPVYQNLHFCEGRKEFDEGEYNNIGVRLRNSEFLGDTDETGNSIIFGQLYKILKKSLNTVYYRNENGFYETAAELAEDLEAVIAQLGAVEGKRAVLDNTKYYVENLYKKKENFYAEQSKNGASGVLQLLLYKYPLYDYCVQRENDEDGCNVLVLGGATYASRFIDLAFELSQVKNCRLDITVVSKDRETDRSNYLATRPAMARFFEIDGERALDVPGEPYGRLRFAEQTLNLENKAMLQKQLEKICGEKNYTYVFVSLGEGKQSRAAAEACAKIPAAEGKKLVSYIVFEKETKETAVRGAAEGVTMLQLSVFDSIDKHKEYEHLRRMAFNAHLTWADGYINDIPAERGRFAGKYNFNSSLGNALSIRYKLHSIEDEAGVRFDFSNPVNLAAQVAEIVGLPGMSPAKNIRLIRELTMYEHRRWNVEKITDSWQPLEDFSLLRADTKDKAGRRHPCIVPSGDSFALYQKEWSGSDSWINASDEQVEALDGLDRLSVEMHRHFAKQAGELRGDAGSLEYQLGVVEKIALQDSLAKCVSADLAKCARSMASSNALPPASEVDRFGYYKRLLLGMRFGEAQDRELSDALKKAEGILFPVIQAAKKKNWKQSDESFIRNIPFILSYSTSLHLCVPFFCETGGSSNTTGLFGNVASALMLNPLNVTYIVDGDVALGDMEGFKKSLGYCAKTIQNHRLQTNFNVIILRQDRDRLKETDRDDISALSERIHLVDELVCSAWNQVRTLKSYLRQKSTKFTAIEANKTGISGLLQSANELSAEDGDGLFPMYTFDSVTQSFKTTRGCEFFKYVRNRPHLLADDLFYSRGKAVSFSEPELVGEHDGLWKLYTGAIDNDRAKSTATWKNLCGTIKEHLENTSRIARFPAFFKCNDGEKYQKDYSITFPAFCKDSVAFITDELYKAEFANSKNRFFNSKPVITRIDSRSYRLTVDELRKDLAAEFEKLLVNPFRLAEKDMVEVVHKSTAIEISAFTLRVERMKLPFNYPDKCRRLLEKLEQNGCIRSYSCTEDNYASFTFATENYMRLLKNEGNILELHVYRKAIESGAFDDVKNGATVRWNTLGTSNELDIVTVKGFRTFIIECKATVELRAEYYDKLYPLNNTFGVNNIPVVVADLNNNVSPGNKIQISRGEELGIRTVVNADDPVGAMKEMGLMKN